MSGIYIKGISMPENCVTDDCPCVNREMGFCQADPETRYVYGDRPHWCPLVPVPDHGRLIDADAFETAMFNDPYQDFVHVLAQLPTIIPADEEAENG